jgi:hypothetical protein
MSWLWQPIVPAQAAPAFDAALMAAMNRPHPDIVFQQPKVVPSGLTPPDFIQNP